MTYRRRIERFGTLLAFALCVGLSSTASADFIDVTIDGRAGPWSYTNGGLNTAFQYGVHDELAPVVVSGANGFSFTPGGVFTIQYLGGTTSAGPGFHPFVDANGNPAVVFNDMPGSSGQVAPSYFISHSEYPVHLSELVGTFADDLGGIVGTPFKVGNLRSVTVPLGASRLQLGINDDIFNDNAGSLLVRITGPSAVPEPSSIVLLGCGVIGLVVYTERPRRRADRP
ncbi:MAG: hypothetical protein AB7I30_19335 [Isosphaeraceae bacterium]